MTNRDGIIGGLEYEKNELTEDLSGLTQRHALTENELVNILCCSLLQCVAVVAVCCSAWQCGTVVQLQCDLV